MLKKIILLSFILCLAFVNVTYAAYCDCRRTLSNGNTEIYAWNSDGSTCCSGSPAVYYAIVTPSGDMPVLEDAMNDARPCCYA